MSKHEIPAPGALMALWTERAKAKGADPVGLVTGQWAQIEDVTTQLHAAISGDERQQLHLEAQFKLGKFSAEAQAFVEADAWTGALVEILGELATGLVANAIPGGGAAGLLAAALAAGLAS